ncbi:hypothetical protein B0J14DRAFT_581265 [Halenospora varia]|nr:hypothetical protein B0J14DRAFT_581265 [Halenospora varia]
MRALITESLWVILFIISSDLVILYERNERHVRFVGNGITGFGLSSGRRQFSRWELSCWEQPSTRFFPDSTRRTGTRK